jgi:hypothetical protein
MAKRRSGARAHEPLANEWLYSCPIGLPTPQIAAALGAADHPVTEVSARLWQQDWQMANTFMEAYGYPRSYWFPTERPLDWRALDDWMLIKTWQHEPGKRVPGVVRGRFVGELVIIRQSQDAAELLLIGLLDIVQAHVRWSQRHHSQARVLVVLEGWDRPLISGRVGKRVAWVVNRLP